MYNDFHTNPVGSADGHCGTEIRQGVMAILHGYGASAPERRETGDTRQPPLPHVIFGLSPITRIKVVSNRARVRLRSWLKSKGYIAGEEYGILYYTDDLHRIQESELRGAKLGFRFLPYPSEETIVLSNLL